VFNLRVGVSICLDRVSIESLDLDSLEKDISTVKIFSTVWKMTSRQSRFSWQFEKWHLDSRDFLDSLKNDISTNLDKFYVIKSRFVSSFIFVLIETLNLDISKTDISMYRDISISILIALDCRDPQAYKGHKIEMLLDGIFKQQNVL